MCDRSDTDWDVFDRDAGHVEFRGRVGERCICRGATHSGRATQMFDGFALGHFRDSAFLKTLGSGISVLSVSLLARPHGADTISSRPERAAICQPRAEWSSDSCGTSPWVGIASPTKAL